MKKSSDLNRMKTAPDDYPSTKCSKLMILYDIINMKNYLFGEKSVGAFRSGAGDASPRSEARSDG